MGIGPIQRLLLGDIDLPNHLVRWVIAYGSAQMTGRPVRAVEIQNINAMEHSRENTVSAC